jgi:glycosyltransferase involved in cell wall biosynthesis/GT2 family glycosyltransferase
VRAARLRVALVVREFTPDRDQVSRYVQHAGQELVRAGHQVHLLSAQGEFDTAEKHGMDAVPLPALSEGQTFLTPAHAHADRVYAALRALHEHTPLDAVEFPERDGEGLTTIRAKRLLGEFRDTALTVRLHAPAALLAPHLGEHPGNTDRAMAAHAEEYCVRHADLLLLPSGRVAEYARERNGRVLAAPYPVPPVAPVPLADPASRAAHHVVYAGPLDPLGGADVFVQAAVRLARTEPDVTFTLFGPRTAHRRLGLPHADHLARRIPADLRWRIGFLDPADAPDRAAVWASAHLCVIPARWDNCPFEALEAMAHGVPVVCTEGGGTAELVSNGRSGFVVPPGDPEALAGVLAKLVGPGSSYDDDRAAMSRQARAAVRDYGAPAARRLIAGYRTARRPSVPVRTAAPVSVIVAVHNKGRWLRETLASVRAQTHPAVEIVVVNDGSTDPATITAFHALPDDVVKVDKTNGGPGSAYNAGFAAAGGEFLLPLDGDDLLHPDCVAIMAAVLHREPELAYAACYVRHFGLLDVIDAPLGIVPALTPFLNTAGKRTRLLRRTAVEAVGGYDEELPTLDDWELLVRLDRAGYEGDVVPRALFSYRRHAESLTFASPAPMFHDEYQYILAKHADVLAEQGLAACHHLLHLWKNRVEPSLAGRWRQAAEEGRHA